ncbi:hypothetical protein [Nostoc favosum]|uniref:Uncharacterized protein n=1 Tax=Nostoc favosum CHAB5714 TaxID=2780399 RepID=A0ABS8IBM5_9NOSO|nr:hypothetical protein [Nostoc favosum]MCC5601276.1 hypothetical protein [Nostoc favosum CHAB5714]
MAIASLSRLKLRFNFVARRVSIPLPLTEVQRFEGGTPSPGVWFNLRGQRQQGFEASPHNAQEIVTLLKADEKRLWNRTAAALRVNPNRRELQALI